MNALTEEEQKFVDWSRDKGTTSDRRFVAIIDRLTSSAPVDGDADTWRMPPPHFKPDARWQRHPQSIDEWDAHKDEVGAREFNAKRRLAFAGDLADPRAPDCMALVSRLDVSVVLGRLTWLEARFENTKDTSIPQLFPAEQSRPALDREAIMLICEMHTPTEGAALNLFNALIASGVLGGK